MERRVGWLAMSIAGIAIVGCGGNAGSTSGMDTSSNNPALPGRAAAKMGGKAVVVGIVFDNGGRGDQGFNDSAWNGIVKAQKTLDVQERRVDSKAEKDFESNLTALAQGGPDLVIAVGASQKKALEKVAPAYPNVKFAIVDAEVKGDNVRSLVFSEEQGSFLAGYLAGLMTKTNKVGFVGGVDMDLIRKFESGYAAGLKQANPSAEMLAPKYSGGWDDADTCKAAANVLYGQGADIVYQAAGRGGLGVIKAAKEQGKFAIGVDNDQDGLAQGTVLTSMVKHVDEAVYQTIKDVSDSKFVAGVRKFDLKGGGVGLSEMKFTKDKIGKDNLAKLKIVSDDIIKGEIKVPATREEVAKYQPVALKALPAAVLGRKRIVAALGPGA